MITKYELNEVDIKIAVTEYMAKKLGKETATVTADVMLTVYPNYDYRDQPVGHTITATVTVK